MLWEGHPYPFGQAVQLDWFPVEKYPGTQATMDASSVNGQPLYLSNQCFPQNQLQEWLFRCLQSRWTGSALWLHSYRESTRKTLNFNFLVNIWASVSHCTWCAWDSLASSIRSRNTITIHWTIFGRTSHARRTRGAVWLVAKWKCTKFTG